MWPYGMTRQEITEFIKENLDPFLDLLLTLHGMDVDEIIMNHMYEDAEEFSSQLWKWEAC